MDYGQVFLAGSKRAAKGAVGVTHYEHGNGPMPTQDLRSAIQYCCSLRRRVGRSHLQEVVGRGNFELLVEKLVQLKVIMLSSVDSYDRPARPQRRKQR